MCRSVYLSGLLMSHGTDSVRTRRATGETRIRRSSLSGSDFKSKVNELSTIQLLSLTGKVLLEQITPLKTVTSPTEAGRKNFN